MAYYPQVTFYSTPVTINGTDYGACLQLVQDGTADFGRKTFSGGGINGQIRRVEAIGGNLFRIHCELGQYWVYQTVAGEDRINVFWGSGNIVQLPWPYCFRSHYTSLPDHIYGGWKIEKGDTIQFIDNTTIGDTLFVVKDAKPSAGDDLSAIAVTTDTFVMRGRPGTVFDPTEDTDYEITKFEEAFTSGTGAWTQQLISELYPGETRPVGDEISDIKLLWEHEDILNPLGETVSNGSDAAYLSYATYYWASYNGDVGERQVRINYTAGGSNHVSTKNITPPVISLDQTASTVKPGWSVVRLDSDGTETTYECYGTTTSAYDFNIPMGQWAWYADGGSYGQIVFHPNETGKTFIVTYRTAAMVDISGYPAGLGYPDITSLTYFKKCDTIDIYDSGNTLANLDTGDLVGEQFYGRTSAILNPATTIHVYYAAKGTIAWTEIEAGGLLIYHGNGKIYIDQTLMSSLPDNCCFKVTGSFANRRQETPVEMANCTLEHMNALDTVLFDEAPWDITDSFGYYMVHEFGPTNYKKYDGVWYPDDSASIVAGLTNYVLNTYDPANTILASTYDPDPDKAWCVIPDEGIWQDDVHSPYHYGTEILGAGGGTHYEQLYTQVSGGIYVITFTDNILAKLPKSTIILDAQLEIAVHSSFKLYTDTKKYVFYNFVPLDDPFYGPDSWVYYYDTTDPDPHTLTYTDHSAIAITMMAQRNTGIWNLLGGDSAVGEIAAGTNTVIDVTDFITRLISYRNTPYVKVAFMVTGSGPIADLTIINGTATGTMLETIYRGFLKTLSFSPTNYGQCGYWDLYNGSNMATIKSSYPCWPGTAVTQYWECAEPPTFGQLTITYQLPSGVINRQIIYGNWPSLKVI